MIRNSSPTTARRGIVAPLAALLVVVLLGMVAFGVDMGYLMVARGQAQNAADAAALAAVTKLTERLKAAPIVNGAPVQTQEDLRLARAEAIAFALKNYVAGQGAEVKDAEVEFGYLADPYDHGNNTLDTSGWPARPYNAARVTVQRDKDHAGGSLKLFFAPALGIKVKDVRATATAAVVMGTVKPRGNEGDIWGGLLPFTYPVAHWDALMGATSTGSVSDSTGTNITLLDSFDVLSGSHSIDGVLSATDGLSETQLYPERTSAGNFGTINFTKTKSSNTTSVLSDLIQDGPQSDAWPDLSSILAATPDAPVGVNGEPGISAGMESAVKAIIGQPRLLPLYKTYSGTGNDTFYQIVDFVPITIVDVDLHGKDKYITFQPRVVSRQSLIDGTHRLDFDVTPSAQPESLFLGNRVLVR